MNQLMPQLQKNDQQMFQKVNNLIQMAQKGQTKEVEEFAKNLFKEQGRDFDKEFSEFMTQIKR